MIKKRVSAKAEPFDVHTFSLGLKAVLPELARLIPIAVLLGLLTVTVGIEPFSAFTMNIAISSGFTLLAVLQQSIAPSPVWVIIVTGLLLNTYYLVHSAKLAPYLNKYSTLQRVGMSFVLTHSTAQICSKYFDTHEQPLPYCAFYWGAALAMWSSWIWGVLAGIMLGRFFLPGHELSFIIPLACIGIVVPQLKNKAILLGCAIAAFLALVASANFFIAIICGIAAAWAFSSQIQLREKLKNKAKPHAE